MKCLIVGGVELRRVDDKTAQQMVNNGVAKCISKEKFDLMVKYLNNKQKGE